MTDQEIRQEVVKKLSPFLRNFDTENRGNRISQALSAGLGGLLEDLIVGIIKGLLKETKYFENSKEK